MWLPRPEAVAAAGDAGRPACLSRKRWGLMGHLCRRHRCGGKCYWHSLLWEWE